MRPTLLSRAMVLVAPFVAGLVVVTPRRASAQIEAGQVVDDSLHTPLHQTSVVLHKLTDSTWRVVDTTRTDDRGLFQFAPTRPGIYRVGIVPTGMSEFIGTVDTLAADSVNQRMLRVPFFRTFQAHVYFEFQVSQPARAFDESRKPEYPESLLGHHMEGHVDAQFVVTETGGVAASTIKILRSSDPDFSESVRKFLRSARYIPASVNGKTVRQVVQQTFMFGMM